MLGETINYYLGNLGTDLESLILIIVLFVNLLVFVLGVRIGLMFSLVSFAGVFIIFSSIGLNTNAALLLVLITFGLLTLSLFITKSRSETGDVI